MRLVLLFFVIDVYFTEIYLQVFDIINGKQMFKKLTKINILSVVIANLP